jgi:hypothetical protein
VARMVGRNVLTICGPLIDGVVTLKRVGLDHAARVEIVFGEEKLTAIADLPLDPPMIGASSHRAAFSARLRTGCELRSGTVVLAHCKEADGNSIRLEAPFTKLDERCATFIFALEERMKSVRTIEELAEIARAVRSVSWRHPILFLSKRRAFAAIGRDVGAILAAAGDVEGAAALLLSPGYLIDLRNPDAILFNILLLIADGPGHRRKRILAVLLQLAGRRSAAARIMSMRMRAATPADADRTWLHELAGAAQTPPWIASFAAQTLARLSLNQAA